MNQIPDYELRELLYHGKNSVVYRGISKANNRNIVMEMLNTDFPKSNELARFQLEYVLTKSFEHRGIIKAYTLEKHKNILCMVLEDFGGKSLNKVIPDLRLSSPT